MSVRGAGRSADGYRAGSPARRSRWTAPRSRRSRVAPSSPPTRTRWNPSGSCWNGFGSRRRRIRTVVPNHRSLTPSRRAAQRRFTLRPAGKPNSAGHGRVLPPAIAWSPSVAAACRHPSATTRHAKSSPVHPLVGAGDARASGVHIPSSARNMRVVPATGGGSAHDGGTADGGVRIEASMNVTQGNLFLGAGCGISLAAHDV